MDIPPHNAPQLLAPAGDWPSLKAAVANGADAVYFGLGSFNARARATNFTLQELPEVIGYLHGRNVKGFVAFNTLIFPDELGNALRHAQAIAAAGADAVIVQDLGLARLIHRLAPSLSIHASTQMTLTESKGIALAATLGIRRVILARELSLEEIAAIRDALDQTLNARDIELEAFVHGAICVSFSGQCLASQSLWARSGNRGLCGQACRLPYRLVVDGQEMDSLGREYLLSTHDLAAYDLIGPMIRAGISGFKIEGRLKSAHYVAATVGVYRQAIDAAVAGKNFDLSSKALAELEQSFSRGFTHGFLSGADHQNLIGARSPRNRGLLIGSVAGKTRQGILVALDAQASLRAGDGVVFSDRQGGQTAGGRVFAVHPQRGKCELTFANDVDLSAVEVGCEVWKTDDPRLERELEKTFSASRVARPVRLDFSVHGQVDQPLQITARDDRGHTVKVVSEVVLQRADKHPLTLDLLREQLGRLGSTPFTLGGIELRSPDGPCDQLPVLAPKSLLNDLRRRIVEQLTALRDQDTQHPIVEAGCLEAIREEIAQRYSIQQASDVKTSLHVLVRRQDQIDALADGGNAGCLGVVYCEFRDLTDYRRAVERGRAVGLTMGVATPRIIKSSQESLLEKLAQLNPAAVLVRNLGSLNFFAEVLPKAVLIGDASLNAANEIAADFLLQAGLTRFTPAYDLNPAQTDNLLRAIAPSQVEAVAHQHVPMFHMAHCVMAANLSDSANCRQCAAGNGVTPCRRHQIFLRDRNGADHPVLADLAGNNTVFNARSQTAYEQVLSLRRQGVRHFRVELLDEDDAQTRQVVRQFPS